MSTPSDPPPDTPPDTPPDDDAQDRALDAVPADRDPSDDREAADPRPTGDR